MGFLLLLLPGAAFIWIAWVIIRFVYRKLMFDRLVAKHTRPRDSKRVQAMVAALDENEHNTFKELAADAPMVDIQSLIQRGEVEEKPGRVTIFPGFARSHLKNAGAHYMHGYYLIRQAWAARGSGYADTVSQSGWDKFTTNLESAETALLTAIELDPNMADAYEQLLVVYRGLSHNTRAHEVFDQAKLKFPTHIGIHRMMLIHKTGRWFGTDEAAFKFARESSDADTTGTLAALIPMAHIEYWIGKQEIGFQEYVKRKEVRKEIANAFKRFSSSPRTEANAIDRLNALQYFASVFDANISTRQARKAFKLMKGEYSSAAWDMWKKPEEMFVKAKWRAGA